ncbi:MAG TPA: LLM class flavin-dependent oxidoreductase [Stellaceae bacterium]|nr:LLM class flavin-dependent oxidoreductase [Stellaceae bacterium]
MQAWHFTEMPYPYLPPDAPSTRINLPSVHFDPKIGADLYNRYLDEHAIADELGLDIMLNEHHQTPTCIDTAAPLNLAILARQTKRARLLILGNPVGHRNDPVRVAEEMAMIDCISYGRLECGFVRGVPYEVFASNANPTRSGERLWEGIDLCLKAWATTDGPFNYEGAFWHRRSINLWPRPYQTPHPQIWVTGSTDVATPHRCAERGYVFATFLLPHQQVRPLFDSYRERFVERGLPGGGGIAYMPLVHTADSESEAEGGAEELRWYLTSSRSEPQFRDPPGYMPVKGKVAAMKQAASGGARNLRQGSLEQLRDQGILISGTPDSVARQVKRFYDFVGGFDHLLMMDHAGFMSHERTVRSMTLFAKEVYPQIKDLPRTKPIRVAQAAE